MTESLSLPINTTSSTPPIQFSHQLNATLNQENYLIWKSQIIPVLRGHGLISFLDSSILPPDRTIATSTGIAILNPEYDKWMKQDQLILAWMFSSISPSILAQVMNCETSAQLWHHLHQMHNAQSIAKTLELKFQLQTSQKGGLTCAQFLQHMQSIADRLRSVGSDISDHELVLYTLQGLGSEFESFVTAMSMRSTSPTMAELQGLLLGHEARIRANLRSQTISTPHLTTQLNSLSLHNGASPQSNQSSDPSALYAGKQSQQQNSPWQAQNQPRFQFNSNRGRGYRGRGRGRNFNSVRDKDVQCQICFKWGHSARKCYHPFDLSYSGAPSVSVTSALPVSGTGASSHTHQALVAEPTANPSPEWFLDSGASTHVTFDLNCLSSPQIYSGTYQVHIGNGTGLSISHTSTAYLSTPSQTLVLTNVLHVPTITKNLLSISQLVSDNAVLVEFLPNSCHIKDRATNRILLHGTLFKGLYRIAVKPHPFQVYQASLLSSDVWHHRLGHCSSSLIDTLRRNNSIPVTNKPISFCSSCSKAKAHNQPFSLSQSTTTAPLQVIHTDI